MMLGNGLRQESEGKCRGVLVKFVECQFEVDCFVFPLGGVDLILGMAWLTTLGEVRTDWGRMSMAFEWEGRRVALRGDPQLCRGPIGVKSLIHTQEAQMWALVEEDSTARLTEPIPKMLESVLS